MFLCDLYPIAIFRIFKLQSHFSGLGATLYLFGFQLIIVIYNIMVILESIVLYGIFSVKVLFVMVLPTAWRTRILQFCTVICSSICFFSENRCDFNKRSGASVHILYMFSEAPAFCAEDLPSIFCPVSSSPLPPVPESEASGYGSEPQKDLLLWSG